MNDVTEAVRAKPTIVRPRDAASLILLRGEGRDLELLAGRRPGHVKFMPGVYVFPRRVARDLGGGRVAGRPPRPDPGDGERADAGRGGLCWAGHPRRDRCAD